MALSKKLGVNSFVTISVRRAKQPLFSASLGLKLIMGKVVRHYQTSVKGKAKCHFLGNAAVLNRLGLRVHYAKEGRDGHSDSNSVTSERQITASFSGGQVFC